MKYYSKVIGYSLALLGIFVFGVYFLFANKAQAKDLGIHGKVWEIQEQDIVSYIKSQVTEEKAKQIQKDFLKNSKQHINKPKPVDGISNTTEHKIHYYNPEITLTKDIKDQNGAILHKKGIKINPLDHQPFTRRLLFINGDDKNQVKYAIKLYKEIGYNLKIVLTNGSPIELMQQHKTNKIIFYFDQQGYLTKTFGIETVPTLVQKEGRYMKVEAIVVNKT